MPRGDRTGPLGAGPMTGRGVGICAGYDTPGYMNPSFGGGFGRGRGRGFGRGFQGGGRGWRHQYYATGLPGWARGYAYPDQYPGRFPIGSNPTMTSKDAQTEELTYLTEQAQYFEGVLNDIKTRVNQLQQEIGNKSKNQKNSDE